MDKEIMLVVYTALGHTYTFYNVKNIAYHNKHLKFEYVGFSGITKADFNNIVGITKHVGIQNPNIKNDIGKQFYDKKDVINEKN